MICGLHVVLTAYGNLIPFLLTGKRMAGHPCLGKERGLAGLEQLLWYYIAYFVRQGDCPTFVHPDSQPNPEVADTSAAWAHSCLLR